MSDTGPSPITFDAFIALAIEELGLPDDVASAGQASDLRTAGLLDSLGLYELFVWLECQIGHDLEIEFLESLKTLEDLYLAHRDLKRK